jgi:hypothetical protein
MNRAVIIILAAWNFSFASSATSLSSKRNSLEQVVGDFEKTYVARDLGSLDRKYPRSICAKRSRDLRCTGKLKVVVEHSLGADDRFQFVEFKSFAEAEKWLRKSESGSGVSIYPFRSVKPRQECKKDLCAYNFKNGILHSHLYIKSIKYGYINYRDADDYYIKEVVLLDGD